MPNTAISLDVVLFPEMVLPTHFEERYKEMIAECYKTTHPLAFSMPTTTELQRLAGAAEVIA